MPKSFFSHIFRPQNLLFYLLISYMLYHLFFSNKGLIAYFDLKHQLELNQYKIETLEFESNDLEVEIQALNPDDPSTDMMDEQVKTKMNFIKKDEILLIDEG